MNESIGLGDVVSCDWNGGYADGTVCQVHADGTVDVFRPYVHTADFSCTGRREGSLSVLTYIGFEISKDRKPEGLKLLRKAQPLR